MLRGEFERRDGLVLPNNVTIFGAQRFLAGALRGDALQFWLGLANCVPDPELQIEDCGEPVIGTGGYARQQITRDSTGWVFAGMLNDEPYLESEWMTFDASGAYSREATRLALFATEAVVSGEGIYSLGSAFPDGITINASTDEQYRSFRYRLFLR